MTRSETHQEVPADEPDFDRAWRRFRIVSGAVVLAVFASAMIVAHAYITAHNRANTLTALKPHPLPHDHLIGLGATPARFRATHGAALPHDGFGPALPGDAGDQVPTYDIGNSASPDVVDTLIHSFRAGTTERSALADVRSRDLPADARLVSTTARPSCKILTYRSATIAASGPAEDFGDGTVRVTLSSKAADPSAAYTPTDVEQAYEELYPTTSATCD